MKKSEKTYANLPFCSKTNTSSVENFKNTTFQDKVSHNSTAHQLYKIDNEIELKKLAYKKAIFTERTGKIISDNIKTQQRNNMLLLFPDESEKRMNNHKKDHSLDFTGKKETLRTEPNLHTENNFKNSQTEKHSMSPIKPVPCKFNVKNTQGTYRPYNNINFLMQNSLENMTVAEKKPDLQSYLHSQLQQVSKQNQFHPKFKSTKALFSSLQKKVENPTTLFSVDSLQKRLGLHNENSNVNINLRINTESNNNFNYTEDTLRIRSDSCSKEPNFDKEATFYNTIDSKTHQPDKYIESEKNDMTTGQKLLYKSDKKKYISNSNDKRIKVNKIYNKKHSGFREDSENEKESPNLINKIENFQHDSSPRSCQEISKDQDSDINTSNSKTQVSNQLKAVDKSDAKIIQDMENELKRKQLEQYENLLKKKVDKKFEKITKKINMNDAKKYLSEQYNSGILENSTNLISQPNYLHISDNNRSVPNLIKLSANQENKYFDKNNTNYSTRTKSSKNLMDQTIESNALNSKGQKGTKQFNRFISNFNESTKNSRNDVNSPNKFFLTRDLKKTFSEYKNIGSPHGQDSKNYTSTTQINFESLLRDNIDLKHVYNSPIYNGSVIDSIKTNRRALNNSETQHKTNFHTTNKKKVYISSKHNMFRFEPTKNVFLQKYKTRQQDCDLTN